MKEKEDFIFLLRLVSDNNEHKLKFATLRLTEIYLMLIIRIKYNVIKTNHIIF
nr:Uncharacterised protein [Providencia rettgeri]